MDANESALRAYLKEQDEAANRDIWEEAQLEYYLTDENSEFYPYSADNIMEAICNLDSGDELFLTATISTAAKLKDNSISQDMMGMAVLKVIRNYWKPLAEKQVDIDYHDLCNEQKYGDY